MVGPYSDPFTGAPVRDHWSPIVGGRANRHYLNGPRVRYAYNRYDLFDEPPSAKRTPKASPYCPFDITEELARFIECSLYRVLNYLHEHPDTPPQAAYELVCPDAPFAYLLPHNFLATARHDLQTSGYVQIYIGKVAPTILSPWRAVLAAEGITVEAALDAVVEEPVPTTTYGTFKSFPSSSDSEGDLPEDGHRLYNTMAIYFALILTLAGHTEFRAELDRVVPSIAKACKIAGKRSRLVYMAVLGLYAARIAGRVDHDLSTPPPDIVLTRLRNCQPRALPSVGHMNAYSFEGRWEILGGVF